VNAREDDHENGYVHEDVSELHLHDGVHVHECGYVHVSVCVCARGFLPLSYPSV